MAKANLLRMLITLFCLGGSAAALYNVYFDNTELRTQAEALACSTGSCFKMLGEQRSPFSQTFTFQVENGSAKTRAVRCERSAWLVGPYRCALQS